MSNINKQDCIHNKQIPQCTKMRTGIHHQSITLMMSRNHQPTLISVKVIVPKTTIYDTKVCFKSFVTQIIKLYNFTNI